MLVHRVRGSNPILRTGDGGLAAKQNKRIFKRIRANPGAIPGRPPKRSLVTKTHIPRKDSSNNRTKSHTKMGDLLTK